MQVRERLDAMAFPWQAASGSRITLEHSHFRLTLEHKMIHIITTIPGSLARSKARTGPKRNLWENIVVRTMLPSATPATQHEGRCPKVPRLPRNMKVDVKKCHACQRKWKSVSKSATHATQHGRRCHQAPCLPHKMYVANSDSNKWFYPLSLCRNLCYPVPIQIIPFRLLGGWVGLGLTNVETSGC